MGFECGAEFKIGGEMSQEKVTAIVLAAGRGTRMESDIHKQYMLLSGKPMIYYSLLAFEESAVDEVVLVTGAGEETYCRKEIVETYGFSKVARIVAGGKERYHSVYEGLKAAEGSDYILIHDGARPCVTAKMIQVAMDEVRVSGACVIGMPVKDTIKISDSSGFAVGTPDRSSLWLIQTPQAFSYLLIMDAYTKLFEKEENQQGITDDAMVVEKMTDRKVKLVCGSYENIKVTTPEDIAVAEIFLSKRLKKAIDN